MAKDKATEKVKTVEEIERAHIVQMKQLKKLVQDSLKADSIISEKLRADDDLVANSFGQRLADKVAEFGGSWHFIILFGVLIVVWMGVNTFILMNRGFDPYPFILLNLVLSCLAALQAPVIMMSQNRKEERDRHRAEDDYAINLKAEIEVANLHKKLDLLMMEQIQAILKNQEEICKRLDKK